MSIEEIIEAAARKLLYDLEEAEPPYGKPFDPEPILRTFAADIRKATLEEAAVKLQNAYAGWDIAAELRRMAEGDK